MIVVHNEDRDVMFFILCYLMYVFNWSLRKSQEYFKTVLDLPEFSEPVQNFLHFFEAKLGKFRRNKLSDDWNQKCIEDYEEIVSNTFRNRYIGIMDRSYEHDPNYDEEFINQVKINNKKQFLKKKISKKKSKRKIQSAKGQLIKKFTKLKQKKLTEIYKSNLPFKIFSVKHNLQSLKKNSLGKVTIGKSRKRYKIRFIVN